ncbi:MAG: solute carrier family 23 protein, partial [Candidatus Izemoplasmatales bacterium]
MEKQLLIGIKERPKSVWKWIVLSLQHVFAMFGATVLVPILTGLDAGVALVASGIGTLIYILCTKGKVPVYLGSSFAYITAISVAGSVNGFSSAYVGLMIVGVVYVIVATIIRFAGSEWLKKVLPPVVVGPMIIIIGLVLAPVAVQSAGLDGNSGIEAPIVAAITFIVVVVISLFAKGFFKIVPFICAIVIGYGVAAIFGIVDFSIFADYKFFQLPNFSFLGTYALDFDAALIFLPIAF